jgi:hypothetical protein
MHSIILTNSCNTRSSKLKALSIVHANCLKISLKMTLQIGPKHVAGSIIHCNLIKYKVVSDFIIYILYNILAYIQHKGDVSTESLQELLQIQYWNIPQEYIASEADCRVVVKQFQAPMKAGRLLCSQQPATSYYPHSIDVRRHPDTPLPW